MFALRTLELSGDPVDREKISSAFQIWEDSSLSWFCPMFDYLIEGRVLRGEIEVYGDWVDGFNGWGTATQIADLAIELVAPLDGRAGGCHLFLEDGDGELALSWASTGPVRGPGGRRLSREDLARDLMSGFYGFWWHALWFAPAILSIFENAGDYFLGLRDVQFVDAPPQSDTARIVEDVRTNLRLGRESSNPDWSSRVQNTASAAAMTETEIANRIAEIRELSASGLQPAETALAVGLMTGLCERPDVPSRVLARFWWSKLREHNESSAP